MILSNAMVVDGGFSLKKCDIRIEDGKITELGKKLDGNDKRDMTGRYILPGFVDTHIHGAAGSRVDVEDCDFDTFSTFEATQGVTSLAITTGCSKIANLIKMFEDTVNYKQNPKGSKIAAIHAEGPFISGVFKGAMNIDNIEKATIADFDALLEAGKGLLKVITIAPEAENAIEVIKHAVSKGVKVSMGHTNATYDEAMSAIEAGATGMTHTFNAARPINHREPGVLGAALTDSRVVCEMICDYVHLHPATIKLIYKAKGADGISIISDSGTAAGIKISQFDVEGVTRYVKDGIVRLADGTIAGSAMTVADGVKHLIESGIPIGDVAKMASFNPAKSIKEEKNIGSIEVGKIADLAILDSDYNIEFTYINGECVYNRNNTI